MTIDQVREIRYGLAIKLFKEDPEFQKSIIELIPSLFVYEGVTDLPVRDFVNVLYTALYNEDLVKWLNNQLTNPTRIFKAEELYKQYLTSEASRADDYRKLWRALHVRPNQLKSIEEEEKWMRHFTTRISCGECRKHWEAYLTTNPPDYSSIDNYRLWTIHAHNAVNARIGKPLFDVDKAVKLYSDKERLILRCELCPGDIVTLTAAVRDLHRAYPNRYLIDLETTCGELWENNPYITDFTEDEKATARVIECNYPLIQNSNQKPYHFLHGYAQDLAHKLGIEIPLTEFKGDIHLSKEEKEWLPQVSEITGNNKPYWVIAAGGKYDFTIKWWEHKRYQQVVDHFKDIITFVQVGESHHKHIPLKGVIDLRGKTSLRQLVRLVYHSQGVVCPVTSLMHLAAAVEHPEGKLRPCVVIAGGREPAHWEQYPGHQFIDTIGALPCCANGGCWKARTVKLNDGAETDESLCTNVVNNLPKCMDMIPAAEVIRRIQLYIDGGAL